jgi:hypothetical protein
MKLNLDSVRAEIQEYLESRGIAVFPAFPGIDEDAPVVQWDTEHYPDYQAFLAVAEAAGVKLVALHANEFHDDVIDQAQKRLAESNIAGAERSAMERRLREMRRYEGYTCQIELSFDLPPRIYVFDLRTEWFQELSDMLDQIDEASDEPDLPGPSGYFSKN